MKTSDTKLWDELWKKDISSYDADSVLSDVEEESAIEITNYHDGANVAIECTKCNEVIIDFDRSEVTA